MNHVSYIAAELPAQVKGASFTYQELRDCPTIVTTLRPANNKKTSIRDYFEHTHMKCVGTFSVTFHINASISELDIWFIFHICTTCEKWYLHVSALSDAEYNLYVADLLELSFKDRYAAMRQDEDYERVIIDVREVRAWFRGRHRSVTVADVDMVCNNERKWGYVFSLSHKYLSLNIQKIDTLRGGAFFAAIRLVIHAFEGRHIKPRSCFCSR